MQYYLSLATVALMLVIGSLSISSQALPTNERVMVGTPAEGEDAFEFIGRSDQNGLTVTHYGYLTHIDGLAEDLLFSDPSIHTEATARFTYFAITTTNGHFQLGGIVTQAATGTHTIYFNETPGGNFNDPSSFQSGQPIVTFVGRYHNVLNIQAPLTPQSPGRAIVAGIVDLVQNTAEPFTLNGHRFQLGHRQLRERLSATGEGTLIQPAPTLAFFLIGGNVVVVSETRNLHRESFHRTAAGDPVVQFGK